MPGIVAEGVLKVGRTVSRQIRHVLGDHDSRFLGTYWPVGSVSGLDSDMGATEGLDSSVKVPGICFRDIFLGPLGSDCDLSGQCQSVSA